jgi:hypothetical protein
LFDRANVEPSEPSDWARVAGEYSSAGLDAAIRELHDRAMDLIATRFSSSRVGITVGTDSG